MTLLFRASTSFAVYEDALETCAIPYITVAGRGFYDRPEIRDVLNLLRALADPWDDMALAGLLLSPAFGLSLQGLARLHWPAEHSSALYLALLGDLAALPERDRPVAERARAFLVELLPLVDRVSVAELLQRVVAWTDYRAILAAGAHRLWRNLDKLLADAQASGVLQVQAFLEYLDTLKDVGAREGEAAVEAEGAVRLMTIHKSKGLEFEFVVLADASRATPNQSAAFYLLPEAGLALKPDRVDSEPLAYRYARMMDKYQSESEACRLLYVALTRAKEKVLVSGHFTAKETKLAVTGWMKELLAAAGFDINTTLPDPVPQHSLVLHSGQPLWIWTQVDLPPDGVRGVVAAQAHASPQAGARPLFDSLVEPEREPSVNVQEAAETEELEWPAWRATGQAPQLLGRAIGKMVHKAIQRWRFPAGGALGEELGGALESLLERVAQEEGVVAVDQRRFALDEAARLLARFRAHPLWQAIEQAALRQHEVPYARLRPDGATEVGYIDLLFRAHESAGWSLVDFKSDTIHNQAELDQLIDRYTRQAQRYTHAVRALLGPVDAVYLCFLDACGEVRVEEV